MGIRAVQMGEKSREIRLKRFESAQIVVEIAKQKNVDFVILSGDTFDDPNVDDSIVKRTIEIFNKFEPIPVYILPGNHDPLISGGIWDREIWKSAKSHVHLLLNASEITLKGNAVLYPCPLKQKNSNIDPTSWIPQREDNDKRIRIGVAHGNLDIITELNNFPISKERTNVSGLDYLALGEWHSFHTSGKTVYSGSIEPTDFKDKDSGNVVIINIPGPHENPSLEKYSTRILYWNSFSPIIRDSTDIEFLDQSIKEIGPLKSQILRITPTIENFEDSSLIPLLETLKTEILEDAFFLEWNFDSDIVSANSASINLPEGVLQKVNNDLNSILDRMVPTGSSQKFAATDVNIVKKAKSQLNNFARRAMK